MPTYDYVCEKCGHKFEKFQSMTSEHLKSCPKCKGKVVRLIGSGSGIIFKGTGFYQTDYKNKGKKGASACSKDKSDGCKGCPHA
ncbi:MAG: FmdB family zinc ribbon protein [Candidatus Omnitrophota bacterium]|nr:zinc ribbon domain-containing protein [Candidatus Omnitrophota bacterium]